MHKIGFISCADLSRYFVSRKNPLFTHDDQIAADYLQRKGYEVEPVIWGAPLSQLRAQGFSLLIVRSPWDYSDSEENRTAFLAWLKEVSLHVTVMNPLSVLQWSLDKHYLGDLESVGVNIVPTLFVEPEESFGKIADACSRWQRIVVKPCISAAAKDAYLISNVISLCPLGRSNQLSSSLEEFRAHFAKIRGNRAFIVQPFVEEIKETGEWSLVFLNGEYSHAVHKLPKPGGWLVQDELGGSVRCDDPPGEAKAFAIEAYAKLAGFLGPQQKLLYARVDVMPGLRVGELELVEPELFFLDRRSMQPNDAALMKFAAGIEESLLL